MPARLLLLRLLLSISWANGGARRQVGAARVLRRRGGQEVAAVSVGVAGGRSGPAFSSALIARTETAAA